MTDPGRLNRRLVLEEPVETPDGAGGVTRSFATVATVWAELVPLSARGDVVAAETGATVTHRIRVRGGWPITTRHRLRAGTRIFRIVTLRDADATGRFLEIHAEERTE
jgi:SPP1 family predicted phage head-tail adaptor